MMKTKQLMYSCYACLPLLSVVTILAASWLLSAIIEIYTNNLTMLNTLNRFTKQADASSTNIKPTKPFPGKHLENIFWFVQISDLHISKYRSYGQVEDLEKLCALWLPLIKPSLVLLTGDLTDAKDRTLIGSEQYIEEWLTYSALMKKCADSSSTSGIHWLDIRGNHDTFKVKDISDDSVNMFDKYGVSRTQYSRSSGVYHYIHNTSYGRYAFNGIDVAPHPGPGRPFNFFGVPRQETLSRIEKISTVENINATVWFGHYPLSVTTNPHLLRTLLSISGVAYLCGHLHTLLGAFPQMHAVHSEGLLELEIGDWKENRRFRIGVFDHDMFSFTDATFSASSSHREAIVVFTNPVDARYIVPGKIPFMKSTMSTHIRFLVFHTAAVSNVQVSIDGLVICENTQVVGEVLHTCPWSTQHYISGVHKLNVLLKYEYGVESRVAIEFSLDGTRPPLPLLSVILLLTDFCTMLRMIFFTSIFIMIFVPLLVKKCSRKLRYIGLLRQIIQAVLPQVVCFIDCDDVFWPLMCYSCFICIGPFSVGYFVEGQLGFAFAYGIYTGGYFIEGSLTYLYVAVQLLIFNFTIMVYCGEIISVPRTTVLHRLAPCRTIRRSFHFLLVFLVCVEGYGVYMYWIAYGLLSSMSNALSTLSLILAVNLIHQAGKNNT